MLDAPGASPPPSAGTLGQPHLPPLLLPLMQAFQLMPTTLLLLRAPKATVPLLLQWS